MPLAIAPTYIVYTYEFYIVKKWKNETNKLSFLKIYNRKEYIILF
jgi:hypothetical protein